MVLAGNGQQSLTRGVDDDHLGLGRHSGLQLLEIHSPVSGRARPLGAVLRRGQGHVNDLATGDLDVANVSVTVLVIPCR